MTLSLKCWLVGCVVLTNLVATAYAADEDTTLVDSKYSLKADREALEALRKNIPVQRQNENDEKAFMDQMMTDLTKSPAEVRNKFSSILNKKRSDFSKDMNKTRDEFNKVQKKEREEYTRKSADERKSFAAGKKTADERKSFFDDQDTKRKSFYDGQKDRRESFESDIKDKRKTFDDYVRAKTDEFNQLHRDFSKRVEENRKSLADQKKVEAQKKIDLQKNLEKEYEDIRKKPATNLEVGS